MAVRKFNKKIIHFGEDRPLCETSCFIESGEQKATLQGKQEEGQFL